MTSATPVDLDAEGAKGRGGFGKAEGHIGDALAGHRNSLGFIRLVLATLVIVDHAFPLGGFGADPVKALTNGQATLGDLAVGGFFAISGYLIAKSGMSADVLQFMWRRFLRIFPAYWTVLFVTAAIVAPVLWAVEGRQLSQYFQPTPGGPVSYLVANWTLHIGTYGIYDLLTDSTPYGRAVGASAFNGSLWTLEYEWLCYLLIGVLVAFGILLRARVVVPIVTAFLVIVQVMFLVDPASVGAVFPILADPYRISLTLTFLFGSCIAVYSKAIPYHDGLGLLSGIVLLLSLHFGGFKLVGIAAGAYFVIYLGARLPRAVQWIGQKNDYSYGVYIYGFLVQQVLAFFGLHKLGYLLYVAVTIPIVFGLAWLSWHGVEKHAMALKNWGPGRGWRHWTSAATDKTRDWMKRRGAREDAPLKGSSSK